MADAMHPAMCANCKYYVYYEGVCCNGESEHCADFIGYNDVCDKWEWEGDEEDG